MKMNNPIIVDSSAIVSTAIPTDSNNKKSLAISEIIWRTNRSIIIPGDILSETINVLGKKSGHKGAIVVANKLFTDKRIVIIETMENIRREAFVKFKRQPQSVSFTDCLVMAFADFYETKEIFGFDEAFKKNGYVRVGIDTKS